MLPLNFMLFNKPWMFFLFQKTARGECLALGDDPRGRHRPSHPTGSLTRELSQRGSLKTRVACYRSSPGLRLHEDKSLGSLRTRAACCPSSPGLRLHEEKSPACRSSSPGPRLPEDKSPGSLKTRAACCQSSPGQRLHENKSPGSLKTSSLLPEQSRPKAPQR